MQRWYLLKKGLCLSLLTIILSGFVVETVTAFDCPITLDDYPYSWTPGGHPERLQREINAFLAADQTKMPPEGAIVAIGSSSMKGWHSRIHNDLYELTIIPRGFGGSYYRDVIWFAKDVILPYNPRAVLVYEGDNEVGGGGVAPEVILTDLKFLVDYCRCTLPDLRFYVISIKPSPNRWNAWPNMMETNALMQGYCEETEGMTFIDASPALLQPDGTLREYIYSDGLHFNSAGYDIWASVIAPILFDAEKAFEPIPEPFEFADSALYIDFGNPTTEAGWNAFGEDNKDGTPVALLNGTGASTDVTLKTIHPWAGIDDSGTLAGLDTFSPGVTSDSIYSDNVNFIVTGFNPTLQFDGLDPETSYNFTIFASYMVDFDIRSAIYTASGANKVSGELDAGLNRVNTLTLSDVHPGADGSIIFDFKKADSNNSNRANIYLGAMVIEEATDPPLWAGYPITNAVKDVDTQGFMGWINVFHGDTIWCYAMNGWLYCPEENVGESGAWVYLPK